MSQALETSSLDDLRAQVAGDVITAADAAYDDARQLFNGMIDRRPAVIVRCQGRDDVVAALACARAQDLIVAVRCGGHSTPGFSTCDDGMVIDISPMKHVEIDPQARIARAQAGLTWGELDAATQEHGLAVSGGRVSDTGVTGLALGSGSGWLERMYGVTAQSLLAAEVVLADGSVVRASEDENPELLWGLKGGGGNFGVVTELELRLHPVGPIILAGMLAWPRAQAPELMRFYRDYMADVPDEVGGGIALIHAPPEPFVPEQFRGAPIVGVIFCYVGPMEEGEQWVQRLREFAEPALDMVGPMPYTALQSLLDAGSPKGIHEYFKIDWIRELSDEAIDTAIAEAEKTPSPMTQVIFAPLGGAMSRIEADSLALTVPDVGWAYFCLSMWPDAADDEANVGWTRGFAQAMRPFTLGTAYPNFIAGDEGEARLVASYGPDKYARLVALKERYDPDNVFRLNQNIKPNGAA